MYHCNAYLHNHPQLTHATILFTSGGILQRSKIDSMKLEKNAKIILAYNNNYYCYCLRLYIIYYCCALGIALHVI